MSATRLKILTSRDHADDSSHGVVKLANDADPLTLEGQLGAIARDRTGLSTLHGWPRL